MKYSIRLYVIALLVNFTLGTLLAPVFAQDAPTLPLAEPGPFGVGLDMLTFKDASREDRKLNVTIWYPAEADPAASYEKPAFQAASSTTGAPHPLIIFSHGLWGKATDTFTMGPHLASYGFVVASINHKDENIEDWRGIVYRPLDVLFVLNELAALSEGPLTGAINTDNVGVAGYSYGASTALWAGGAQVDPDYMLNWCAENEPEAMAVGSDIRSACSVWAVRWDEVIAYRMQFGPLTEHDLWPPLSDARIRAVMPMALCNSPVQGELGAVAMVLPTLIVFPELEEECIPSDSAPFVYSHLGSQEKYLLTLLGTGHMTAFEDAGIQAIFRQFGVAFFGYYLQENTDYVHYLTPEFAAELGNVMLEMGSE